jgi:hypothetical protein
LANCACTDVEDFVGWGFLQVWRQVAVKRSADEGCLKEEDHVTSTGLLEFLRGAIPYGHVRTDDFMEAFERVHIEFLIREDLGIGR